MIVDKKDASLCDECARMQSDNLALRAMCDSRSERISDLEHELKRLTIELAATPDPERHHSSS